jgi:hypothetical protein
MIFSSPHYYLTVFLCVSFCFLIDLLVQAWRFEIRSSPTDFLRKIIKFDQDINEKGRTELFNRIFLKIRQRYIGVDFEREEKLEEKRDLKTNKYGNIEIKNNNVKKEIVKRQPRNEIELEFITQEE